jgi:predicted ribosome quality control (RQC) complex YloA/Tae2 family protein
MQLTYPFLTRLVKELKPIFEGAILDQLVLQDKGRTVMLHFKKEGNDCFWRFSLFSDFQSLGFPSAASVPKLHTPRFRQLTGLKVLSVELPFVDRRVRMYFEMEYMLEWRLYGSQADVWLFHEGKAIEAWRRATAEVLGTPMETALPERTEGEWKKKYSFLGAGLLAKINAQALAQNQPPEAMAEEWVQSLPYASIYVMDQEAAPKLTFWESEGEIRYQGLSALEALKELWSAYFELNGWVKQKALQEVQLKKKHHSLEKKKDQLRIAIQQVQAARPDSEVADILMASLHLFSEGAAFIETFDFYRNETIRIPLPNGKRPQEHAANLYRKSKNKHKQIEELERRLLQTEEGLVHITLSLETLTQIENAGEWRKWRGKEKKELAAIPDTAFQFKEFHLDGWLIRVGRNAKNNDVLTFKASSKNDLWLHARDVPGSHVLIRAVAGKLVPPAVLEKAAALAAYYSKRKTESLAPVILTERKFVRKVKGMAAGMVRVEKEKIIMIDPSEALKIKGVKA